MALVTGREIAADTIVLRELKGSPLSIVEMDWDLETLMGAINVALSNETISNVISGSATFGGIAGVSVLIGSTLDGVNYVVNVTPTDDSEDVGAVYVSDKTTTTFTVYCTGTGTPTFDWILVDNN